MRFSANRMYVESYEKCPNCGVLLYETPSPSEDRQLVDGKTYCSSWCVEWTADRKQRRSQTAD